MTLKEARERFQVQGIDNDYLDEHMVEQEEAFRSCVRLLEGVEKTKTVNRRHTSYGLKHFAEHPSCVCSLMPDGEVARVGCYVYEGTLILAALSLGFACKYTGIESVTCYFNIGEPSLRERMARLRKDLVAAANR